MTNEVFYKRCRLKNYLNIYFRGEKRPMAQIVIP